MKNLYLITSAIGTKFGVFDTNTRFLQTLNTYSSIREQDPTAVLVHLEMAALPLSRYHLDVIRSATDYQIIFTDSPFVQELYNSTDNWDIVKNVTEVMCFSKALRYLTELPIEDVDRCFKVSGRYMVTNQFNPKIVTDSHTLLFAKPKTSQFLPEVTGGCLHQYMSRCWGFPKVRATEISEIYEEIAKYITTQINSGGYVDIEHCLYKFLHNKTVCEVDIIGVTGQIGPNGQVVQD